jgi:hypothetical protein
MIFGSYDAWLLVAIKYAEQNNKGASLIDVVATADYINHSVMTFSEFETGIKKFLAIGLIQEKENRLHTTRKLKLWWSKMYGTKRVDLIKAMSDVEKYLNQRYAAFDGPLTESSFTQEDFGKATTEYLRPK